MTPFGKKDPPETTGAGGVAEIIVATTNKGKVAEFGALLAGLGVKIRSLRRKEGDARLRMSPEPVEDGETFYRTPTLKRAITPTRRTGPAWPTTRGSWWWL